MNDLQFDTIADIVADPTLSDDDIVKNPADPSWSKTVGELRLASRAHDNATPPDPWTKALEVRRAAEAGTTPNADADFETEWKKNRAAELAAEAARRPELRITTLSDAERGKYAPPDGYKDGLDRLRAANARALAAKESR